MYKYLALAVTVVTAAVSAHAQDAAPAGEPPITLQFCEKGFQITRYLDLESQEYVFKKEPPYQGMPVRGAFSADGPGFALDPAAGTLHVDLNGNNDLTDDPAGVFKTDDEQTCKGIRVTKKLGPGEVTYVCDFSSSFGTDCKLDIHSGWRGECTLSGKSFRIAVADDMEGRFLEDAVLLVEPLEAPSLFDWEIEESFLRDMPGVLVDGRVHTFAFLPGENGGLKAHMQVTAPPTGTIVFRGKSIYDARFSSSQGMLLLPAPQGEVKVPEGIAPSLDVRLFDGSLFAKRTYDYGNLLEGIPDLLEIKAGKPVEVADGGPLRNSVKVKRNGGSLVLDYTCVGNGGELYEIMRKNGKDEENPPKISIFSGDALLVSGQFEYG